MNDSELTKRLIRAADQCVKCGLCLPHCPTYREMRDEAESPRGRIALIQGWVEGQIPSSPGLQKHLGNCLECRACETACPSLVRFGDMMDNARALSTRDKSRPARLVHASWLRALSSESGARGTALLAGIYRVTGIAFLADQSGLLQHPVMAAIHRLVLQIKRLPRIREEQTPGPASEPRLALFLGCIARAAQPEAVEAAVTLLRLLGYSVDIPKVQACCGAMHRHNGFPAEADRLLERNVQAFNNHAPVGISSACVAELRTRPELGETRDICRLLADATWPARARLSPLPLRVLVHEPCSQRNALRDGWAAYDLLRRIPEIELVELPDNAFCCGAAGTYMLQRPRMAETLLQPKLAALAELNAAFLVTTNTGCALHLAAGIREAGLDIEVLHPIELIARQLNFSTEASGTEQAPRTAMR